MSKRMEITAQTKQNIIDAFWSLYCVERIEKITVKDITNKAGYNRGTFYEYFTDVYAVLEDIEASLIPTYNELPPMVTPTRTIGMPIELFFEIFERNKRYYAVLLGEKGDPAFASKLKNSVKPMIIEALVESTAVNRKELDYILEYTLSAMIGIMSYKSDQADALTNIELHALISRLTEQGMLGLLAHS